MSFIEILSKKKTNISEHSSIDSRQTNVTNITTEEKPKSKKKVYFKGVEIIDVESYKEYNQMTVLQLESIEKNVTICKECNCTIF